MDAYHKLLAIAALVFVLVGIFLGYEWLQAHDAQLRAEAKVAADQAAFDKLTTQQKELSDQLTQVRKGQVDQLATVAKQFNQAQSPQQFATLIAQLVGLKQAPIVVTPAPTPQNPNPQPVIELPDAPQVKTYFQQCEECKTNYAAAQKALTIAEKDKQVAEEKLKLKTDEAEQWKQAAKGGTWKRRAGNRAMNFLVDAGITALVLCGSGRCK